MEINKNYLILIFAGFLLSLGIIGCKCEKTDYSKKMELEMKLGKYKCFKDPKMKVGVTSVKEDSRCPEGTNCVWAGKVTLELEVIEEKESKTLELTFEPGKKKKKNVCINKHCYKLLDVTPAPTKESKPSKKDYRFKVRMKDPGIRLIQSK